jgi:O-antigen ligase
VAHGHLIAEIALAAAAGFALVMLGARLKFTAVLVWVGVGGLAYDFIRYPTQHSVVTFDRLWVVAMLGWLFTERRRIPTSRASRYTLTAGFALVAAYGLRALLMSAERKAALETWFDAGLLPAVMFLAARRGVINARRLDSLGGAFTAAGVVLAIMGIAQRLGLNPASRLGAATTIGRDVGLRASGPYQTDDILAVALLVCFAMTIYWVQRDRVKRTPIGLPILLLEAAGIGLTFFRGAYIGILVIVVVALGLRPKRFARLLGAGAVVAVVALVAYSQLSGTSGIGQRLNNAQNVSGRLATYQEGYEIFKGSPVFGVGVSQFSTAEANVLAVAVNGVQGVDTAHSSYVEALAETGLIGFLPLLALTAAAGYLVVALSRVAREPSDTLFVVALTGGLLAFLVMSLEETTILISTDNLFLAVMLGVATARLDSLEAETKADDHQEPQFTMAKRGPGPSDLPPLPVNGHPVPLGTVPRRVSPPVVGRSR